MKVSDRSLDELVSYSTLSIPLVWARSEDKAWFVTSMLDRYLGTFTDCIYIMHEGEFVGSVDGYNILSSVLKNPTYDFFQYTRAEKFMTKTKPFVVLPETQVSTLIEEWKKTKRAYAMLKNNKGNYTPISARTLTDAIAMTLSDDVKISNMQGNYAITCSRHNTIGEVIRLMLSKGIRRIFFEDDMSFISDRTIIRKIVTDFEFLHKIDNFLDLKIGMIESIQPTVVKDTQSIKELIKTMSHKEHPCGLLYNNKIITCYDIVMSMKN